MDSVAEIPQNKSKLSFGRLSFVVLFATLVLTSVFFIPSSLYSLPLTKTTLAFLGIFIALIIWAINNLRKGSIKLPLTPIAFVGVFIVLESFMSSLFSPSFNLSVFGQTLDATTFSATLLFFAILFLTALNFSSKRKLFYTYIGLFLTFAVIAIFHALRLTFGPTFLSFGLFPDLATNVVGKWNDLGIFLGSFGVLSIITLDLLSLKMMWKVILWISLIISLILLAVINFSLLWIVLTIFSAIFGFYLLSVSYKRVKIESLDMAPNTTPVEAPMKSIRIPYASILMLIISVAFLIYGQGWGEKISNKFQIFQVEARPSWASTYDIVKSAYKDNAILGVGPNRFVNVWLLNKPSEVNQNIFWNNDFTFGIGLLPTLAVTTGILGVVGWVAFIILFLYLGFKSLFFRDQDLLSRYFTTSSFLISLFFWIFAIFYIPSIAILVLTFLWTGMFLACAHRDGVLKLKTLVFANRPKLGFFAILILIATIALSLGGIYAVFSKFRSSTDIARAVKAYNVSGSVESSEKYLQNSLDKWQTDIGYRFLSEIALVKINRLLSEKTDLSQDAQRTKFQALLSDALRNAQAARDFDKLNYQNWTGLGRVYEAVVPLAIDGAYANALSAYNEALRLNPHNPELYLIMARLEVSNKNNKKAFEYINLALKEKNNYTEAIFFLSQLQVQEGDIKSAIQSANAAALLAPNDSVIQFQLGLLQYNAKNYKDAVQALSQAVKVNPVYANAKYFLGLSLYELGDIKGSTAQFESIASTNPDNAEIKKILANLKAGKAPVSDSPEKRTALPVKEK